VTFYHEFRRELPGRRVVKLCRAEACQSMGGDALAAKAEQRLGIKLGETTPDRRVTLEPVYCLGLCATAPSCQVDDRMIGRLTESKLNAILTEAQS
jgi:formate dehydrogenase subunit gamma